MFIAAFFVMVRTVNNLNAPQLRTRKMRYIYTIEYYSHVKKNSIRIFEGKWKKLEKFILKLGTRETLRNLE